MKDPNTYSDSDYSERKLTEVSSGETVRQFPVDGAMATASFWEHPYRRLADKSFVTLKPIAARIDDDRYPEVFDNGGLIVLDGGCEICMDNYRLSQALEDIEECGDDWDDAQERRPDLFRDGLLVPLRINDPAWPKGLAVLVCVKDVTDGCNPVERNSGPRVNRVLNCGHGMMRTGCLSCQKKAWQRRFEKLREAGHVAYQNQTEESEADPGGAAGDESEHAAKSPPGEAH